MCDYSTYPILLAIAEAYTNISIFSSLEQCVHDVLRPFVFELNGFLKIGFGALFISQLELGISKDAVGIGESGRKGYDGLAGLDTVFEEIDADLDDGSLKMVGGIARGEFDGFLDVVEGWLEEAAVLFDYGALVVEEVVDLVLFEIEVFVVVGYCLAV